MIYNFTIFTVCETFISTRVMMDDGYKMIFGYSFNFNRKKR